MDKEKIKILKAVYDFILKHEMTFNIFNHRMGGPTYSIEKKKFYHSVFIDDDDKNKKYYIDLFLDFSVNNKDRRFLNLMGYEKYLSLISGNMVRLYSKKNKLSDINIELIAKDLADYIRDNQLFNLKIYINN